MKTIWKIINEENGKTKSAIDIQSLVINNNIIVNQNKIANIFNNYFISIVDTINSDNSKHVNTSSYIFHGVEPLVDPFRFHISRSLFKGLP